MICLLSRRCLPHARGGVSQQTTRLDASVESSPRPWGCFCQHKSYRKYILVFPTPVGVFPVLKDWHFARDCLPHARGGVSRLYHPGYRYLASSPRPWGCFRLLGISGRRWTVFPTPVGVFLTIESPGVFVISLPHARGGVSRRLMQFLDSGPSSPRPWGCFSLTKHLFLSRSVFPTPVGVFLLLSLSVIWRISLPHARGGVSTPFRFPPKCDVSSPRPWGCFWDSLESRGRKSVFPTPVGVFLAD